MAEEDYSKSTQQLDLEARLAAEKGEVAPGTEPRSFAVEGNDLTGYVGVSPEYQTYAEDTHKPSTAEEGAEQVYEERVLTALEERDENSSTASGVLGYNVDSKLAAKDGGSATSSESETSQASADDPEETEDVSNDEDKAGGSTPVGNTALPGGPAKE